MISVASFLPLNHLNNGILESNSLGAQIANRRGCKSSRPRELFHSDQNLISHYRLCFAVVQVGLVGFVAVLGASSLSVVPEKHDEIEKVPNSPASSSSTEETDGEGTPKTPTRKSKRASKEDLGTFTSPEGRRISRRLQNKQKDQ